VNHILSILGSLEFVYGLDQRAGVYILAFWKAWGESAGLWSAGFNFISRWRTVCAPMQKQCLSARDVPLALDPDPIPWFTEVMWVCGPRRCGSDVNFAHSRGC